MKNETITQRKVALRKRDHAIMTAIATNRFITSSDIRQLFWKSQTTRNHYTRLNTLTKAGLIEPLVGDNLAQLGYRLTKKGIAMLSSDVLKTDAIQNRRFSYKSSFDHDKLLVAIRRVFEESPLVSGYIPEHEVRRMLASRHGKEEKRNAGYKVPDGLFKLKTAQKILTVAVELELTLKSKNRYQRIFRELLTSADFDVVFILTANANMARAIRTIALDVRANDPYVRRWPIKRGLYFLPLDAFLTQRCEATFEGDGQPFSLKSLEKEQTAG
ncbi:MAG: hypothetical protein HY537_13075 [Deltaproteobacteria bacterium]|nr:hypothetical protein [Deltaproteobacteria bacterium]